MKQDRLAMLAGISTKALVVLEAGKRDAGLDELERLAVALDIKLATLFQPPDDEPLQSGS